MTDLLINNDVPGTDVFAAHIARISADGVVQTWFAMNSNITIPAHIVWSGAILRVDTITVETWGTFGSKKFYALVTFDAEGARVTEVTVGGQAVTDRASLTAALRGS